MNSLTKQSDQYIADEDITHSCTSGLSIDSHKAPGKLCTHDHGADCELDTFAFILAGGRGSRLQPLTADCCKPAVPFGGSCRIIDFTLSNCINSGIQRIGVLTQHRQNSLIEHLRNAWNQSASNQHSFVDVLPAQFDQHIDGYRGTADAVAQNLGVLQQMAPKHTLILAGDHVYKADYRRMIRKHLDANADVSVACCEVPASHAHRFGVMELDSTGKLIQFQEKPQNPATLADKPDVSLISMGIYLFNTEILTAVLQSERMQRLKSFDFGTNILPSLIREYRVHAYHFDQAQTENYWQDIGTIDSYFEANAQLLRQNPAVDLNDADWPIHTGTTIRVPTRLSIDSRGYSGSVCDCIVADGCRVNGARIRHSILFDSVTVNEKSVIENSLILPGAVIGKNCKIKNTIVNSGVHINDGCEFGYEPLQESLHHHLSQTGILVVAKDLLSPATILKNPVAANRQIVNTTDTASKATTYPDQFTRIFN